MAKVILFGSGRGADVAYRFLTRDSDHSICGFTVDREHWNGARFHDLPVVPFDEIEHHFPPDTFQMLTVLGYQEMNGLRRAKYEAGKAKGYRFISYVNSHFYRAEDLAIGENCFILDNQSISLDVKIGNNVVMWSSNHIGDRTIVEDDVWIASQVAIAADATIGRACFLGINATIGNNVHLAERTFVGAHSLVSANTSPDSIHLSGTGEEKGISSRRFLKAMIARGLL